MWDCSAREVAVSTEAIYGSDLELKCDHTMVTTMIIFKPFG